MIANVPQSPIVDSNTLRISREWLQWLLNPQFLTIDIGSALGTESGGTGTNADPTLNYLLVGTGSSYSPTQFLPLSAFPGLTGDVSATPGNTATTLAVVNLMPGPYGDGQNVSTFTANAKGLVTASGQTPITGAPGAFAVTGALTAASATFAGGLVANAANITTTLSVLTLNVGANVAVGGTATITGAFGCNGATAQTSVTTGAAVATTAATNVTPYGFTTAAQADRIVSLLNTIRAALVSNGILVP